MAKFIEFNVMGNASSYLNTKHLLNVDLISEIKKELKDKISGEVALNITSGSGKEHMALLSVLMQCEVGFRFVALTKEGIKEV